MSVCTIDEIRSEVSKAARDYNEGAEPGASISHVSLFGSYADGRATSASDVDLLVGFTSSVVGLITLARSMSKKGCSLDNSAMGGFFGRMRNEMFYGEDWSGFTTEGFVSAIADYMAWYNTKRSKVSLGCLSPMEYRMPKGLVAA